MEIRIENPSVPLSQETKKIIIDWFMEEFINEDYVQKGVNDESTEKNVPN